MLLADLFNSELAHAEFRLFLASLTLPLKPRPSTLFEILSPPSFVRSHVIKSRSLIYST